MLKVREKGYEVSTCSSRVVPDTDLAGYPANNFAGYRITGLVGYRISGKIVNIDIFF